MICQSTRANYCHGSLAQVHWIILVLVNENMLCPFDTAGFLFPFFFFTPHWAPGMPLVHSSVCTYTLLVLQARAMSLFSVLGFVSFQRKP